MKIDFGAASKSFRAQDAMQTFNGQMDKESEEYAAKQLVGADPFDIEPAKAELLVYEQKINEMVDKAQAFEIVDDESNSQAVQMGLQAKKLSKLVKEIGADRTKEHRTYVGAVRNFVKVYTTMLDSIESGLKEKFKDFSRLQEMKRREAERAAQKAAEQLQERINREAKKKHIDPIIIPEVALPTKQEAVRTEEGSGSIRKVWTFRIVDWSKIDRKLLEEIGKTAMAAKLKDAAHHPVISKVFMPMVKAGVRSIPGIEIFQEEQTILRG